MKHDYEVALSWFNKANWDERVPYIHAIRYALKLAAKLEQEPSEGMQSAGMYYADENLGLADDLSLTTEECEGIFQAMLEQAKREIE